MRAFWAKMPLDEFYKKIQNLQQFDIAAQSIEIIKENAGYLADLLRSQLRSGVDALGEPITLKRRGGIFDYYADRTIWEKEFKGIGLGKVTEVITNYMTGEFYTSLSIKTNGTEFEFYSPLFYFPEIVERSGVIIIELSKEHLDLFAREILHPQIKIRFNEAINGI